MNDKYKKYEPIFGSWYLTRLIGRGSFGEVYEIHREEYGTTYRAALKIISVPQDEDDIKTRITEDTDIETVSEYYEEVLKEIIKENEIMSKLKGNSNIVSYEDHQIIPHEDGIGYDIFIRMELLTPLLDRMVEKNLCEKEVVKLGIDICKALDVCHKKNIIHRDIKPQNIFISGNDDYKLGDFGIARTIEKTTGGMSKKGTYKYMAPEVFRGDDYDITVDIYSLGMVLYSLLNGNREPFLPPPPAKITHNDEENARNRRFRGEKIPSPRDGSEMLAFIIKKACAAKKKDRYFSAELMMRDLESYYNNYNIYDHSGIEDEKTAIDNDKYLTNVSSAINAINLSNYKNENNKKDYNRLKIEARNVKRNPFERSKKLLLPLGLITVLIISSIIGTTTIIRNKEKYVTEELPHNEKSIERAEVNPEELIEVLGRDINFSQVDEIEKYPVDVIIKIKNNMNSPINKVDYSITYNGETFMNRNSKDSYFTAYGYVEPGEIGFLYSQAEFEKKTPRSQGDILINAANKCQQLDDYSFPYGEVISFDEKKDTYDVKICNPNNRQVNMGTSIVIAYRDDEPELADAWGCGVVRQTIYPGETITLKDAIHDPGFSASLDEAHYAAFVIEKDLIGIDD